MIDTIENHDETILADLNDESQYDKLPSNPIEHVKIRVLLVNGEMNLMSSIQMSGTGSQSWKNRSLEKLKV